jgi:hypothetical protein
LQDEHQDLAPAGFFLFHKLKISMNGMTSINPRGCSERIEGDVGKKRLFGHFIHCMGDVNVVPTWAGTILSDGINEYFIFYVWILWFQFKNMELDFY